MSLVNVDSIIDVFWSALVAAILMQKEIHEKKYWSL